MATDRRPVTPGEIERLTKCLKRAHDLAVVTILAPATKVRPEVPFAAPIDGFLITSVIDVLATLPEGSTLVVDWRTGEHFDAHREDYDLQIGIYHGAAVALTDSPHPASTRWVRLEAGGHITRESAGADASALIRGSLESPPPPGNDTVD